MGSKSGEDFRDYVVAVWQSSQFDSAYDKHIGYVGKSNKLAEQIKDACHFEDTLGFEEAIGISMFEFIRHNGNLLNKYKFTFARDGYKEDSR